ncbi:hypothetical protein ABTX60_15725 [Streptomyces sp. NPDC126510]|uniref:hypothetical protein n=1 Tax=Streptomyces sp. NPDC126510 TaxID=3155317 RepID=UPI003324C891
MSAARPTDPAQVGRHGLEIVKAVTEELLVEQEPVGERSTARVVPSDTAARR